MLDRRTLFKGSAAVAAVVATSQTIARDVAANTSVAANHALALDRIAPRGHDGIMVRYGTLDLESHNDLISGIRVWTGSNSRRAAADRAAEIYARNGIALDAELSMKQVLELVKDDPIISMWAYSWMDTQHIKWKMLRNHFHARYDEFLSEMERFDNAGPGVLEMDTKLHVPGYCRHEIHQQPGGYVGDPFAGHIYHYATNVTADRRNDQDQSYMNFAALTPIPEDGKVRRILDLGTGIGQYATSIKRRFPNAEVWGIDVSAPMLRYGHMRAVDMGVAVNFSQRLAEDTKFPDGHFDMVISHLLHHELTGDATNAVYKEAQRILRPGGQFYGIDTYTNQAVPRTAMGQFELFWVYRWNREDWQLEWSEVEQEAGIKKAGMKVWRTPDKLVNGNSVRGYNNVVGTKI
ncbi:MAG: class I SAM-dependent methyltransferase [Steroidobacteraceae bacterium]